MVSSTFALVVSKMLMFGKSRSRTLSTGSKVPTSSLRSSTNSWFDDPEEELEMDFPSSKSSRSSCGRNRM